MLSCDGLFSKAGVRLCFWESTVCELKEGKYCVYEAKTHRSIYKICKMRIYRKYSLYVRVYIHILHAYTNAMHLSLTRFLVLLLFHIIFVMLIQFGSHFKVLQLQPTLKFRLDLFITLRAYAFCAWVLGGREGTGACRECQPVG